MVLPHNYDEVVQLLALLDQWTRAEVMARLGPLTNKGDIDYSIARIKKEDEIRRLLYDTDDLVKLGVGWGLLEPSKRTSTIRENY